MQHSKQQAGNPLCIDTSCPVEPAQDEKQEFPGEANHDQLEAPMLESQPSSTEPTPCHKQIANMINKITITSGVNRGNSTLKVLSIPSGKRYSCAVARKKKIAASTGANLDRPRYSVFEAPSATTIHAPPLKPPSPRNAEADQQPRADSDFLISETGVTREELNYLKRVFHEFDEDGNQFIDVKEMQKVLRQIGYHLSKQTVKKVMADITATPDKELLNFDEFVQVVLFWKDCVRFQLDDDETRGLDVGGLNRFGFSPDSTPRQSVVTALRSSIDEGKEDSGNCCTHWLATLALMFIGGDASTTRGAAKLTAVTAGTKAGLYSAFFTSDAMWRGFWDMLMLCLLVYSFAATSFFYAVYPREEDNAAAVSRFENWKDNVFVVEIIVCAFLALDLWIWSQTSQPVVTLAESSSASSLSLELSRHPESMKADTATHRFALYVKRGGIFLDFSALIPFWLFVSVDAAKYLHALRFLKVIRIWHLWLPSGHNSTTPFYINFYYSLVPLCRAIGFVFLGIHSISILLIMNNWTMEYNTAIYVSLYIISSVGVGDVRVATSTTAKKWFANIFFLISMMVNGYVIGNIVNYLQIGDVKGRNGTKLRETAAVCDFFDIPDSLRDEILQFQAHILKDNLNVANKELLEFIPKEMREHLLLYSKLRHLQDHPLFVSVHRGIIFALAQHMDPVVFCPGEFVAIAGEVASEMFFISHGFLDVMTKNGLYLVTMKPGDYFGERGLLGEEGTQRPFSAKALTYCDFYVLGKNAFATVVSRYPQFRQQLLQYVEGKKRSWVKSVVPGSNADAETREEENASPLRGLVKLLSNMPKSKTVGDNNQTPMTTLRTKINEDELKELVRGDSLHENVLERLETFLKGAMNSFEDKDQTRSLFILPPLEAANLLPPRTQEEVEGENLQMFASVEFMESHASFASKGGISDTSAETVETKRRRDLQSRKRRASHWQMNPGAHHSALPEMLVGGHGKIFDEQSDDGYQSPVGSMYSASQGRRKSLRELTTHFEQMKMVDSASASGSFQSVSMGSLRRKRRQSRVAFVEEEKQCVHDFQLLQHLADAPKVFRRVTEKPPMSSGEDDEGEGEEGVKHDPVVPFVYDSASPVIPMGRPALEDRSSDDEDSEDMGSQPGVGGFIRTAFAQSSFVSKTVPIGGQDGEISVRSRQESMVSNVTTGELKTMDYEYAFSELMSYVQVLEKETMETRGLLEEFVSAHRDSLEKSSSDHHFVSSLQHTMPLMDLQVPELAVQRPSNSNTENVELLSPPEHPPFDTLLPPPHRSPSSMTQAGDEKELSARSSSSIRSQEN